MCAHLLLSLDFIGPAAIEHTVETLLQVCQSVRDCVLVAECAWAITAAEFAGVKCIEYKPVYFDFFVGTSAIRATRFFLFLMEVNNTRVAIQVFAIAALLWLLNNAHANRAHEVAFERRSCCRIRVDIQFNVG